MTGSEFIKRMSSRQSGLTERGVAFAVEAMLRLMGDALAPDERLEVRGFGSFLLCSRSPYTARNPLTGEAFALPKRFNAHVKSG